MSQVSHHKLNNKVYEKIFTLFPQFLGRLSRKGKEGIVIDALFSKVEQVMVAKRVAISFMLVSGYTYQQISSKLKVSYGTIGKISEITKHADSSFIKELQRISTEDAFREFLSVIDYKISLALPPKGRNWSQWRKEIEQTKHNQKPAF